MRGFLFSSVASLAVAIAMHVLPPAWDSFDSHLSQGRSIKIFRRGWPISYVAEGPLRDQRTTIALKLVVNFTLVTTGLTVLAFGIAGRSRSTKHSESGKPQSHVSH